MLYHHRKLERMQLGKSIKSLRGLKGFPLKYVATELGMSISNLSNIENGITGIEQNTLKKLGDILGVDHQHILVFNPEKDLFARKVLE
jgi:transcriptional regulator with XRE-family HTH domain